MTKKNRQPTMADVLREATAEELALEAELQETDPFLDYPEDGPEDDWTVEVTVKL